MWLAAATGFVCLALGFLYGAFARGQQDKTRVVMRGFMGAGAVAMVLATTAVVLDLPLWGPGTIGGFTLTLMLAAAMFLAGTWLGDRIEHRIHGAS